MKYDHIYISFISFSSPYFILNILSPQLPIFDNPLSPFSAVHKCMSMGYPLEQGNPTSCNLLKEK